ncbi:MAG: hypothetical protein HYU53_12145 [Acidobacteria bacterium]|nr:hypothetical protein [Acidobacteriota bacterium]
MSLSESDVRDVFKTAFGAATANDVELSMAWYNEQNREIVCGVTNVIRFSNNYIRDHTHVRPCYPLTVKVAFGNREALAITNRLDRNSIVDAVRRAEAVARAARPTTDHRPVLGPQKYPVIAGYDARTAGLTAEERYQHVAVVLDRLQREKLNGSGYFHVDDTLEAHVTSAGLWFYRRATKTGYTVTVRSDSTTGRESSRIGSGWAGIGDMRRVDDVDIESLTAIAIDKARRSMNPQPFEMGAYTVILEPAVTAGFVRQLLGLISGSSVAVDQWGAPGRVGEKRASERLTVRSKPDHPLIMASPYGHRGHPAREAIWIEKGIVRNLPGGEAGPAEHLVVDGSSRPIEALVADLKRGVLVTQAGGSLRDLAAGYVNGVTKNGLFLIENGKVTTPLKNAWYRVRIEDVLGQIEDISKPYKTALFGSEGLDGNVMPAIRVANFSFYRPSDAV